MGAADSLQAGSRNDREQSTLAGFARWPVSRVGHVVWLHARQAREPA